MSVFLKDTSHAKIHQGLVCLGETVTDGHWQQNVVTDPVQRTVVATAIRGELRTKMVSVDDLLRRENAITYRICHWAGVHFPRTDVIDRALRQAEVAWNGLTVHDRFIPAGLGLPRIYQAIYGFNEFCANEWGNVGFKLCHDPNKEWWRTNNDVQHIPTEAQIIRLDFREVMLPTNMAGAPFNLSQDDQEKWVDPYVLMSAEELSLLQLRSGFEYGHPLWGYGWARCRNAYGSGGSLCVLWDAGDGLGVNDHSLGAYYNIGAVRRKSVVLVP